MNVRTQGRLSRRRPGAAVVEAALVLPVLLLFLLAILEFSRYMAVRQVIGNAVRDGARFAVVRVNQETTDEEIKDIVYERLAGFGNQLEDFDRGSNIHVYRLDPDDPDDTSTSWKAAGFGEYIAVEVVGTYRSAFSSFYLPGAGSMTVIGDHELRMRSVMYSEAN